MKKWKSGKNLLSFLKEFFFSRFKKLLIASGVLNSNILF